MLRERKRRQNNFKYVLLLLLALCAAIIGRQEYRIYQIRQEQEAARERIEALRQEKDSLEKERKKLDDMRYIEKLAREEYNMVKENEVPLFIINAGQENKAGQQEARK